MRIRRPFALAAAAALVTGLAVTAYAKAPALHVLRVALPDGGVETIRYTGDVAPRVAIAPAEARVGLDPFAGAGFDDASSDARSDGGLDHLAAMMDAHLEAMLRGAVPMPAPPGDAAAAADGALEMTALADAPAGARSVSVSSVTVNGHTCTTRVETIAQGAGHRPKLLGQVSGDGCAATGPKTAPPRTPAPPAPPASPRAPAGDTI